MTGVPFAVAEAAIAQPPRNGSPPKTPRKRRIVVAPDRSVIPEQR